ncbi:nucleoside diphosphate kinase 7, putative [Ichthyophthirius multifiliis]|uniref:Nucleoside diphosphate kinase 7, putative n=1 Tax=Ichthyophthirius multifiliis TaxID=5932 RepID=G0R403_ICHMU|nr:nucleoside diphosphate kinase 7, putative [Ichthyophthirius multifiliis]EGR27800.1 nucleoside diphosphate kinase 7, putative [Ichthyophthirius multifiliis]|eukprot:XP_004027145.1 nucleoside diphosphate kinase 7, putative [Ichthyophthirius multifiliis]
MADKRYTFIVEWFDTSASLIRTYNLIYYLSDKTIEMYDLKNKRVFLKKSEYTINESEFYLGSVLTIYSRQLKITNFADIYTRQIFQNKKEKQKQNKTNKIKYKKQKRTFAMIKPDAYNQIGNILSIIEKNGLQISNIKMTKMQLQDAEKFYEEHRGKPFYETLTQFISSDLVVGLELVGDDSIKIWRNLLGPTNTQVAKQKNPQSIRAQYGTDGTKNACHGSDSHSSAFRELNFFFSDQSNLKPSALLSSCSCCIIKPHIIKSLQLGQIINTILLQGFQITGIQSFFLDRPTSDEFYEVYKGVLPEYNGLSEHLTSGMSVVLEVRQQNSVQQFRELCGPHDPEIARTLRSNTIRAQFGVDRVKNAVHCTDLDEDGILEVINFFSLFVQLLIFFNIKVEYFFKILQK